MIHFSNKHDIDLPPATLWEMVYRAGKVHITISFSQPTMDGEVLKTYPGEIETSGFHLGTMDPRFKRACEITASAIARNEGFDLIIPDDYFWVI